MVSDAQPHLINCLKRFNCKERFWLLQHALGTPQLDQKFLDDLTRCIGRLPIEARGNKALWWAMDYHANWLIGALLKYHGVPEGNLPNLLIYAHPVEGKEFQTIQGNQEDFDLVIAIENTIILIEAKGVGSWNKKQLRSKCRRLHGLYLFCEQYGPMPDLYLVFASRERPNEQMIRECDWPKNLKTENQKGEAYWLPLVLRSPGGAFDKIGRNKIGGDTIKFGRQKASDEL